MKILLRYTTRFCREGISLKSLQTLHRGRFCRATNLSGFSEFQTKPDEVFPKQMKIVIPIFLSNAQKATWIFTQMIFSITRKANVTSCCYCKYSFSVVLFLLPIASFHPLLTTKSISFVTTPPPPSNQHILNSFLPPSLYIAINSCSYFNDLQTKHRKCLKLEG